jgi:hypothetical protein
MLLQDGAYMVVSSNDDSIIIYDCQTGMKKRQVNSKKYGVDLIQFTHTANTAIHCSRKMDGAHAFTNSLIYVLQTQSDTYP